MPIYSSNMESVVQSINLKVGKLKDSKRLLGIVAEQLTGDLIIRIHEDGKDADGGKIGSYSTKEMYVSLNYLSNELRQTGGVGKNKGKRLTAKGKFSSDAKFKNGKARKSRFFEGGYKEFKSEIFGDSNVTLTLTGSLQGDLSFEYDKASGGYTIGYSNYGGELYKHLEEHFGKVGRIFIASDDEINEAILGAKEMVNHIINE